MMNHLIPDNLDQVKNVAEAVWALYGPWIIEGGKSFLKAARDEGGKRVVKLFSATCSKLWSQIQTKLSSPEQKQELAELKDNPDAVPSSVLQESLLKALSDDPVFAAVIRTTLEQLTLCEKDLPQISGNFSNNQINSNSYGGNSTVIIGNKNKVDR